MTKSAHVFSGVCRVLLLSPIGTGVNPYIGLLRDGLAAAGADVRPVERLDRADWVGDRRPDVIHLHWLDHYDVPRGVIFPALHGATDLSRRLLRRTLETLCNLAVVYQARRWLRLRDLLNQLRDFQRTGGRIAYTVHNVAAHEGDSFVDRWGTARLLKLADVVHVHDTSTAESVATHFGRRARVAIIPHGHYIGSYPNEISRAVARRRLGLPPDAFVYLALGLLRPYKGLEELIPAFRGLPGRDAILLLAGKPSTDAYVQTLARLRADDVRVRLSPQFVPAQDVQAYLNAADICVLPYRQITTSGAALLALSFGAAVLAPAIGAFPNLLSAGRGILYDPNDPASLARALIQARATDWQAIRPQIIAWTAQFDWTTIGEHLLAAYNTSNKDS